MDASTLPPELGTPEWWSVFLTSSALARVAAARDVEIMRLILKGA
ncbi:hypothetical protein [Cellulomonas persica]|uniref:Uncharacterized protein n=1 Tax=Cellulomonas persica TaxID=76861 RepID=A0A510UW87_9CELL|nr:hypothetical protein [Cellulomonas persica]GEK18766.1 hypothetical protein CPE01_24990 [Cellulomonas persica]